ncbi:MAG TPA: gamma-glutamyl-gamma-aminobutyrate hydrolase family protein [Alphaproteobacteria bacterium]|jgi:putative glutamine amidotransferase|nr:gamma-glutamyl-gamma-aminobutyrate hydrolase family protein [Alphaproteobacteria bacterium]
MSLPLIGVTACMRPIEHHEFHAVAKQYVHAVADAASGLPLIIPALGKTLDIAEIVARIDGLLLTGSPSNVEPRHYSGSPPRAGTKQDPERDATTLPLIRRAIAAGVPVLGLCRGVQELNVALGGTLHQHVHELPGARDHRAPDSEDNATRYAPVHFVRLAPGGMLARLAGADEAEVNSLHAQAIDRLAPRLVVEATAPDGVVEAVRLADGAEGRAAVFALGVQWHPEWHIADDRLSRGIFAAFGDAARARAAGRGAQGGFAA